MLSAILAQIQGVCLLHTFVSLWTELRKSSRFCLPEWGELPRKDELCVLEKPCSLNVAIL